MCHFLILQLKTKSDKTGSGKTDKYVALVHLLCVFLGVCLTERFIYPPLSHSKSCQLHSIVTLAAISLNPFVAKQGIAHILQN